jgi:nucleoside-diphosphate-sugar epimerase
MVAATGIAGFLGAHVKAVLERNRFMVEGIPRALRRSPEELRQFLVTRKPEAIIHLAGIVDVRRCREHPLEAFQSHVMDTANLLEAVRVAVPETPLVYIATDKSFGEQEGCGLETPYQPGFPYETSKACEDFLVESYRKTYGTRVCLLRFPNFFGEGDGHLERLIPSICEASVKQQELAIRTRLDGTTRQYIYVRDAAEIVARCAVSAIAREPVWPANHFGPPFIKTVGDVIRDVETVTGRSLKVKVLNLPGEVSRLSLRDENFLNYRYTDWLPALDRTARWYQEQLTSPGRSAAAAEELAFAPVS